MGLIFLADRVFVITLLFILLPFIINDCYGKNFLTGLLTLFFPFIMYPYFGYIGGVYSYDVIEETGVFFKKKKLLCILLIIFSIFIYTNFTRLVEENSLVNKNDGHYVNKLYMSDGRVYNNYLDKKQKKMYMYILNNTKSYKRILKFNLSDFGCVDYDECTSLVNIAHEAILVDHPELINYAGWRAHYDYGGTYNLILEFSVNNKIAEIIGEMRIQRIIDEIKKETMDMNELEKIRYVYKWIGKNNTYDKTFTTFSKNQSIYNVFLKKNAVCAGFAKASSVIFQNIGINSYIITGTSTGPHMWNIVEYNGKYYYFDSTVATNLKEGTSYYYDGLRQSYMNDFIVDFPTWYPKIEKTEDLYNI